MLQEIFYWIFNMSITAAVTGVLVLLVRQIKKIPRRLSVFLWLIPFLRMTIPFGLNSPYSLMSLLSKITTKTIIVYQPTEGLAFSMTNSVMAAETYFPITYKVNILEDIFAVASVVWIIVLKCIVEKPEAIHAQEESQKKDLVNLEFLLEACAMVHIQIQ